MEPSNRFQGMNKASLCSLAGRYDNPIPPRFIAPKDSSKIPAPVASTLWCLFTAPVKETPRRITTVTSYLKEISMKALWKREELLRPPLLSSSGFFIRFVKTMSTVFLPPRIKLLHRCTLPGCIRNWRLRNQLYDEILCFISQKFLGFCNFSTVVGYV